MGDADQIEGLHEVSCEECATLYTPGSARGWRVVEEADGPGIWYCPACAEREFGPLPGDAGEPFREPFRGGEPPPA